MKNVALFALALGVFAACSHSPSSTQVPAGSVAVDSGKADGHGYSFRAYRSQNLAGGASGKLWFQILGSEGTVLTEFVEEHTKLFHLILVSEDLGHFEHLHPTLVEDGLFEVEWTPPNVDSSYHVYAQVVPAGEPHSILGRFDIHIAGETVPMRAPVVADTQPTVDGNNLLMLALPEEGFHPAASTLTFMVHDAVTGELASDLEPFLGARAHLVAIQSEANGEVFMHTHALGSTGGQGGHGGHGTAQPEPSDPHAGHHGGSGPSMPPAEGEDSAFDSSGLLPFELDFQSAGIYRLWVQYRRAGQDVTQFVTIEVGGSRD